MMAHALAPLAQVGVEHALGGVIDNDDHGEPLRGHQGQPLMATAIQMQQLAKAGAGFAAPPMAAAGLMLGHQAGGLQRLFHEGVAEAHAVVAPGELMKVADVEALVPVAVEGQQALHLADRARLGEGVCRRRSNRPS
jgi:hypothetical protein